MSQRIDRSVLLALGFGFLLGFGGAFPAFGQATTPYGTHPPNHIHSPYQSQQYWNAQVAAVYSPHGSQPGSMGHNPWGHNPSGGRYSTGGYSPYGSGHNSWHGHSTGSYSQPWARGHHSSYQHLNQSWNREQFNYVINNHPSFRGLSWVERHNYTNMGPSSLQHNQYLSNGQQNPFWQHNLTNLSSAYSGFSSPSYSTSYASGFSRPNSYNYNSYNNSLNNYNYNRQTNTATPQAQQNFNQSFTRPAFDQLGQIGSRAALGDVVLSSANLKKSLEIRDRAQQVGQAANAQLGQAITYANLAHTHLMKGELKPALEKFEQAQTLSQVAGNQTMQAAILRGKGMVHFASGDAWQALDSYRQARSLMKEIGNHAREAEIVTSMGWTYQSLGELQRALEHYNDALRLSGYPKDKTGATGILAGVGLVYQTLGEPQKAMKYYSAAFDAAATKTEQAGILTSAGELLHSQRNHTKALEVYQRALTLVREEKNKAGQAGTLISMGRVYSALEQFDTALHSYDQALLLMREVGNKAGEAGTLASIGEVHFWKALRELTAPRPVFRSSTAFPFNAEFSSTSVRSSQPLLPMTVGPSFRDPRPKLFPVALKHYQEALGLMREVGNRSGEIAILTNIGSVYDAWEKPEKALEYYLKSIEGLEAMRTAARLEEFRTSLAQQSVDVYQRAIWLHLRLKQRPEAFNLSERARARTFLDQLGNARLEASKDAAAQLVAREQTLSQELAALKQQLDQARAKPTQQLNQEAIRALETSLAAKRSEYEDLRTYRKLLNPKYASAISVEPLTLTQAQSLLDAETTLVSYFVTPEKTLAFLIARDSFRVVETSVSQQELEQAVAVFRDFSNLNDAPMTSLKPLYKWLVAPIKSHLKTPQVGIIPHGVLHKLPFAALTDGKQYLSDNHTVFYLPSVSALPHIRQNQKPGGDQTLALAYGDGEGANFLRYADEEAQAVGNLYGAQARVGAAATESFFRANASEHNILHVVAHYQLDKTNPLFSRLLLAPGNGEDGSLELHEVYGLELKKANLVVLSVCQSQVGAQSRGDDIIGLNRAFMSAGAPTVIASLWSVDDRTTSELMAAFYKRLKEGMGKAAALQAAQAEMRARNPHPYHWAGFVLTGHPGTVTAADSDRAVETFGAVTSGTLKN